jgi:hypothetical protein
MDRGRRGCIECGGWVGCVGVARAHMGRPFTRSTGPSHKGVCVCLCAVQIMTPFTHAAVPSAANRSKIEIDRSIDRSTRRATTHNEQQQRSLAASFVVIARESNDPNHGPPQPAVKAELYSLDQTNHLIYTQTKAKIKQNIQEAQQTNDAKWLETPIFLLSTALAKRISTY